MSVAYLVFSMYVYSSSKVIIHMILTISSFGISALSTS